MKASTSFTFGAGWVFSVSFCFWHNMTLYQSRIYVIQGRYYLIRVQRRYSSDKPIWNWELEIPRFHHDGRLWFIQWFSNILNRALWCALWILCIRTVGSCSCPRKRLRSAPVASARAWNERGQRGQQGHGSKSASFEENQQFWPRTTKNHNDITMREPGQSLNPDTRISSTPQCSFWDLMVLLRNWLNTSCPGLCVTSGKDHNLWKYVKCCEHV